jgi:predicted RNase H-like HicB family nuclease
MKIKVVVHEAEEGGYWVEVPAIPGCATEGETFEELLQNLYEAVEGCLVDCMRLAPSRNPIFLPPFSRGSGGLRRELAPAAGIG